MTSFIAADGPPESPRFTPPRPSARRCRTREWVGEGAHWPAPPSDSDPVSHVNTPGVSVHSGRRIPRPRLLAAPFGRVHSRANDPSRRGAWVCARPRGRPDPRGDVQNRRGPTHPRIVPPGRLYSRSDSKPPALRNAPPGGGGGLGRDRGGGENGRPGLPGPHIRPGCGGLLRRALLRQRHRQLRHAVRGGRLLRRQRRLGQRFGR